jgi:hypothetical protein
MLNKFYFFVFLLVANPSYPQSPDKLSGYVSLESEISSGSAIETFLPETLLTLDGKNNILEYNIKLNRYNGEFIASDTLNIFFINIEKGIYSAYIKLDINEKPYLNDNVENKRQGVSFFSKKVDFFSDVQNIKIKDTVINSILYKLASGSKISDNSKITYEAFISKIPHNFPIQISKIVSTMTDGGFVEKVIINDEKTKKKITFKCNYKKEVLPDKLEKIMKVWSEN